MLKSVADGWASFNSNVIDKSKVPTSDKRRKALELAFYAGALSAVSQWEETLHNEEITDAQAFEHYESMRAEVREYFLALAMDLPGLKH